MHLVQNSEGWSKNALASEFNIDRRSIDKLIKNIAPCGKKSGHPVWALRDVLIPIARYLDNGFDIDPDNIDPEKLKPFDRKAWFDSEIQRVKFETQMGQLIPADEVAAVEAEKNKRIALHLETMADVLERDCGLNAEQVSRVNQIVDNTRAEMYNDVMAIEIDASADNG